MNVNAKPRHKGKLNAKKLTKGKKPFNKNRQRKQPVLDGVKVTIKKVTKETSGGKHLRTIITDFGEGVFVSTISGDKKESTVHRKSLRARGDSATAISLMAGILSSHTQEDTNAKFDSDQLFRHALIKVEGKFVPIATIYCIRPGTEEIEMAARNRDAELVFNELSKFIAPTDLAEAMVSLNEGLTEQKFRSGTPFIEYDKENNTIATIGLVGPDRRCVAVTRSLKTGLIVSQVDCPEFARSIGVITRGVADQFKD